MNQCPRCKGSISYEIQEEDGFQFVASICPCATERDMVNSDNIRYYENMLAGPAKPAEFIVPEEMTL